ncbi:hypothetical protein [Rheinheimera sp.]|uniref:hypothetical protein n=1 Tax=Rheinheimera sp. TaxID=1869214 RepID=UPI0040489161
MRKVKSALVIGMASMLAVGCASTSDNAGDKKAGSNGYPVLEVLSDKPYVWDDSVSEALNVARMAQPAGVGNGMRDFADGTLANTGRIGGGTRVFDAGLGLLSQGIFGVISMEALNQGVNRQLDWKPSIVDFIPVKDVPDGERFKYVQNFIGDKLQDAFKKVYGGVTWHGPFTPKRVFKNLNTEYVLFDNDGCKESLKFEMYNKNSEVKYLDANKHREFIEGNQNIGMFCNYGGVISIAGKRLIDGEENYIVVFESSFGHFFDSVVAKHYDGYFIMPEMYFFSAIDRTARVVINRDKASVYKSGSELLFTKI